MAARYEDYKRDYEKFLAESRGKNRPRRSICLLLATLLGLAYSGFLLYHFLGGFTDVESDAELLGTAFATYLVAPHMVLASAAALCGLGGWLARNRWLALTAGILYLVAGLAFPIYFLFVVLQGILSIVAFALMGQKGQAVPSYSSSGKKGSRAPVVMAVLLVCALGLGAGGWYYVNYMQSPESDASGDTTGTAAGTAQETESEAPEPTPAEPISLTAGEYTVGTHIPAGRYRIETEDTWCTVSTDDFFQTLDQGDGGYTCDLEEGDELTCSQPVTLTPVE